MVWIWVCRLELGCLFRSVQFSGRLDGRFLRRESEQPDPIKKFWECPKSQPAPCSFLPQSLSSLVTLSKRGGGKKIQHTYVTSDNKCFRNRSVSFEHQYFSTPLSHVRQGETTHYCAVPSRQRERSWGRQCVRVYKCTAGEKTQEKGNESQLREGVLKVDPKEHILVCQMNQQQGVATRCPTAPPAHVSSSISQMVELQKFLQPLCWLWHVKFVYSSEPH